MKKLFLLLLCGGLCKVSIGQSPKLMLPIGHTDALTSVSFSPDEKQILTSAEDNTAKLWDRQSGRLIANLAGHTEVVVDAIFSPDGQLILTSSTDNTAKVWNSRTGQLLYTITPPDKPVRARFSPDGKKILVNAGKLVNILDTQSGNLLVSYTGHTGAVVQSVFSSDGRRVASASINGIARVWDAADGRELLQLPAKNTAYNDISFSADGRWLATASNDRTAQVWDVGTGRPVYTLRGHRQAVAWVGFTKDGSKLLTRSDDSTAKVWELATGRLLYTLDGKDGYMSMAIISDDGSKAVTAHESEAIVWDLSTGKNIAELEVDNSVNAVCMNKQGNLVVTGSSENNAMVWNIGEKQEKPLLLDGITFEISCESYNKDGTQILTGGTDGVVRLWDAASGQLLRGLVAHEGLVFAAEYSPDGKRIVSASNDSTIKIWDAITGRMIKSIKAHNGGVTLSHFSPDGLSIISASADFTIKIWDAKTFQLKKVLANKGALVYADFTPDNSKIVAVTYGDTDQSVAVWENNTWNKILFIPGNGYQVSALKVSADSKKLAFVREYINQPLQVWGLDSLKMIRSFKKHGEIITTLCFTNDSQKLISASDDSTARLWDLQSGKLQKIFKAHTGPIENMVVSPDGNKLITGSWDNTAKIWDINSGNLICTLTGHTYVVKGMIFSPDNRYVITQSTDNTLKKWDAATGELFYTFFATGPYDYLVLDKYDRYDGTPAARKLLYFTCGTEVIELDQFKDLCWEPGLAKKIMGMNREPITARKISEVNICNVTPEVIRNGVVNGNYQFTIIPRNGGLGEVQLYVNGKMILRYRPESLTRNGNMYGLSVSQQRVQPYFLAGYENEVMVRATTNSGGMTSRGVVQMTPAVGNKKANPNMYIVSVGVNKYKGENIQLHYASTDAESFASALTSSAKKLLNTDGKEHVLVSTFSTETGNQNWPAKNAIQARMEEIARAATPEDILVFFFAGHGVLVNGQKNLYLLTAEAMGFEMSGVETEVAISTDELNKWMQNIKANKQLLILDACNSGQAVKDMQELIAKRDVPADQVRALENLKDKNGTFILSASASGQSAYETSQYGQGLLTYSLLSSIKNQGALKENKYIDVTSWFNTASDNVRILAKEVGGRQEPQIIGSGSYYVGLVDEEVMNGIKINAKKKIFARSVLYSGDPTLLIDPLQLASEIDKALNNLSARGSQSPLSFIETNTSADAYSIRGNYEVNGDAVMAKLSLINQNKKLKEFQLEGKASQKELLARNLVQNIIDFLKTE